MSEKKYTYTIGRRKTATASIRLFEGKGASTVNSKPFDELYKDSYSKHVISEPFLAAGLKLEDFHFTAVVKGSGPKGQLEAIRHGLARAVVKATPDNKKAVRQAGLLTRDPRMVERKKPGLHKARKAEQYSKR